jgi:hypothetical protein
MEFLLVLNMLPTRSLNVMLQMEIIVCLMLSVILQDLLVFHVHEVVVEDTVVMESSNHMPEKNVMSDLVVLSLWIADGVVNLEM